MIWLTLHYGNALGLDPSLDNYIEAHVHGLIDLADDVEAIVLDPSYRGSRVEELACSLGSAVEWHTGIRLAVERAADCEKFRGIDASRAIVTIADNGLVTPKVLGEARDRQLDYETAK